ncbi:MAG: penicillin-binding transpeptidase domain-containing protein [Gemmatimonadota bacterium]|nr:penicillin-binding transpeptidase domain-containing protein [Gemmatimonadota bacterium]
MTRFGLQSAGSRIREALEGGPGPISPVTYRRRHRALVWMFTAVAVAYGGRLGHLQLVLGDEFRNRAVAQSMEEKEIPASRGEILDRHGTPLVSDDTRYHAYLSPVELRIDRESALEAIESVVALSGDRRARLLAASGGWHSIASGLSDEEKTTLETSLPSGLGFEASPARRYPRGSVARRLIGRVATNGEGQSGLELHLDALLRGEPGRRTIRVDAQHGEYRSPDAVVAEPRPGHTVVLTIDAELQRIAESELSRVIAETEASAGDILIYQPQTGELLAVASQRRGSSGTAVPAFADPYEPGSTAKPFLLAALLNEGLVDLDELIDVEGGELRDGRRVINDVHGFEELSVREILAQSSNVGAAKLAQRIRPPVQHSYLRDFGFGMPTQVQHPSESGGKLRRFSEWTALSPASHAMGYELSATSLQLVAAYGALANGGRLMRPTLVREIRDDRGRAVWSAEPTMVRQVVRPDVARTVSGVLADVVREGTGKLAGMARLSVAGKTGTARLAANGGYASGRYRASFVGFAPADRPRVVILTRIEDPRGAYYGGAIAAPVSQATLQAALATRVGAVDGRLVASGVEPRRWSGAAPGADRGPFIFAVGEGASQVRTASDAPAPVELPNVTGLPLRAAVSRLHGLGLRVELHGSAVVREQEPAAGRQVRPGRLVVLR